MTVLAIALLLAATDAASAHSVFGVTGFKGGLLHPLLVPTHALTVAALALLIGQQHWRWGVPAAYVGGIVAGLGAIALAYVPGFAEEKLLGFAATAGLLVALARPLPCLLGVLLAVAIGVAQGLDSPPEVITLREANLTLLGTALGATFLMAGLAWLASLVRSDWQRIGARIAGSWIAASAILVLALRLAK